MLYIIAIILLLVLDAIWISLNLARYKKLVYDVQKSQLTVRFIPACIAYILMVVGLLVFVLPQVQKSKNKLQTSIKYGGLYGLTVYGIFNATNAAMFKNYDAMTATFDTLWGTALFVLTPYLASIISQRLF